MYSVRSSLTRTSYIVTWDTVYGTWHGFCIWWSITKPSTTTSWQYCGKQYQIWLTRMYILRRCTFRPTCFDWYTVYSVQEDQIIRLGHAVLQRHCDLGDCIWNMTWILHQMTTDGKQEYIPKDLLLLMTFLSEINKELWQHHWIYPLGKLHSLQYQTWQLPHGHWKTWKTGQCHWFRSRQKVPWPQDPSSHPLPREQESHQNCVLHLYIKSVRIGSICHILTRESVHPFARPCFDWYTVHFARTTQTDILSKRVWSCPTRTLCFPTALQLGRLYMTCILHQMITDGKQEYVPKDQPLLWDYSVFCPRVSNCPDSDILFSNYIATRNTVHDMGFATDDDRWQTGICSKWSVDSMRFLWGINKELWQAPQSQLPQPPTPSWWIQCIKSVWLGFPFWVGSWCSLLPNLFWWVHCAFCQNHPDGYTAFSPRVIKLSNSDMLFYNDIATQETIYGTWHGFCIAWRLMAKDLLLLWDSFEKTIRDYDKTHFHIPYWENKNLTGTARYTSSYIKSVRLGDESLTSLAVYFRNWHMFSEYMNNIPC